MSSDFAMSRKIDLLYVTAISLLRQLKMLYLHGVADFSGEKETKIFFRLLGFCQVRFLRDENYRYFDESYRSISE